MDSYTALSGIISNFPENQREWTTYSSGPQDLWLKLEAHEGDVSLTLEQSKALALQAYAKVKPSRSWYFYPVLFKPSDKEDRESYFEWLRTDDKHLWVQQPGVDKKNNILAKRINEFGLSEIFSAIIFRKS